MKFVGCIIILQPTYLLLISKVMESYLILIALVICSILVICIVLTHVFICRLLYKLHDVLYSFELFLDRH